MMATSLSCYNWSTDLLKQKWNSMFTEKYYRIHNDDLDIQCIFLLLEGANEKLQQLAGSYTNTTLLYKQKLTELEEKNKEINYLKKEILKKTDCEKCTKLEIELAKASKKAIEAQKRMNSIARILCLGNLESSDSDKRNTALGIVSQMLLDSSPKRKRKCVERRETPSKENTLVPASFDLCTESNKKQEVNSETDDGIIIPDTMTHSPLRSITNFVTAGLSVKKKILDSEINPLPRCSTSLNLPIEKSPKITSAKKNLSADDCTLRNNDINDDLIDKKKKISFNIDLNNLELNKISNNNELAERCGNDEPNILDATLVEYVKDGRTELEKIWFSDDYDKGINTATFKHGLDVVKKDGDKTFNQIVEETPSRDNNIKQDKRKRADFWMLKEKRELSNSLKHTDIKKLRQTKLELGVKPKSVDISTLPGFNGGIPKNADKDDDIIPASPGSVDSDRTLAFSTQDSCVFQPLAASTQRSVKEDNGNRPASGNKSPTYVYKRETVRKKSERAKLSGWDCDECKKYYSALSKDLSPNKVKERMNMCSRHRDKFKPKLNETPPGFWNPLFPDTQECKEKGMYVSIHYPKENET